MFQYFWIAIYIGTYGYWRGSSALILSCFLYYSLRTFACPKYSGHDVNAILNVIKILSLSVNLSIVEIGCTLWVWLVGVVSRRWVWFVGGIYGCG